MSVPSSQRLKQSIQNGIIPKEGPKAIPVRADLRAVSSVLVDLGTQNELQQISFVQCVYIDNSQNASPVTIQSDGTNQTVGIGAGKQGYLPLLSTLPNRFIIQSVGAVIIPIVFLNVPMPFGVWSASGSDDFQFDGTGNLLVSDATLAALITNQGGGNGLNINPLNPALSTSGWVYQAAAGGIITNVAVTIVAALANVTRYLTDFQVINVNAVPTEFSIRDGTTVIWRGYLPANMTAPYTPDLASPLRGSNGALLSVICGTTAAQVYFNAQGFNYPL